MKVYKKLNATSGVTHYEIEKYSIKVQFNNGSLYVYDYEKTGREHVIKMIELAALGKGLSTYISKYVKDKYAFKLK